MNHYSGFGSLLVAFSSSSPYCNEILILHREALSILHSAVTNQDQQSLHTAINITQVNQNRQYIGLLGVKSRKSKSFGSEMRKYIINEGHLGLWNLLESGADPETPVHYDEKSNFCTPIHLAARDGSTKAIELLLAYKAEINSRDMVQFSPLHRAVQHDHLDCVKLLMDSGAIRSLKTEKSNTILSLAIQKGNISILKYLLEQGESAHERVAYKRAPLHIAARFRQPEAVQILIDHGAEVDARDYHQTTPFMKAACIGDLKSMRNLLEHGAAFDATSKDGISAFSRAANGDPEFESHQINAMAFLLGLGADINHQDNDSWSALHLATKEGKSKTVKFLLEQGARHDIRTNDSWLVKFGEKKDREVSGTPLEIAHELGYADIITQLVEHEERIKSITQ
jgi:ankyrin repeat protein